MSANVGTWKLHLPRAALARRIWQRMQTDDCFDLAAQTAFYFVLSLFPFLLVLAVVVGWLPSTKLWVAFATWVVRYLPSDSRDLLLLTILKLTQYSPGFLSFGLLAAIWSASAGFVSLMESLSVAFGVPETRSYVRKHILGIAFTMLAAFFALAAFGVMAFGRWELPRILADVTTWNMSRALAELGRWTVTVIILCVGIDLVNFVLPNVRRKWRWISPGTVFAVLTLITLSALFNLYFQHFTSYPRIYGALGGFVILMLWIYVASVILVVGAEIDSEIERPANGLGSD
jgi:membrane protein